MRQEGVFDSNTGFWKGLSLQFTYPKQHFYCQMFLCIFQKQQIYS